MTGRFASSFALGYGLKQRGEALEQRKEEWKAGEQRRTEEEKRRKAEEVRRKERYEWEQLDREKKENFEKGDRILRMARQRMAAGQEKEAAALYNQAYKYWPDGNDAMVILPQSQPEHFQQLLETGQVQPEFADSKVLVVSKQHGVIPFESMEELDKMMGAAFDQKEYLGQLRTREGALAAKNEEATLNPMQAENGSWMRKSYDLDPSGIVRFKGYVPHEGPIPMSEEHKALRALGLDPYGLTDEQKEILANLRTKAPSKAQEKLIGKREKRAEESHVEGLRGSKQTRELRGKQEERAAGVEQRAEEVHDYTVVGKREQMGRARTKEKRDIAKETREEEKHKKAMKGGLLQPKERASLYAKAEKAYRENFSDPTGQPTKDAPDKEKWINEYMDKALGTPKASPGGAGAGKGGKEIVQEFLDKKTGNRRVVLGDGTQQIINPDGDIIAERQPIKGLRK